MVGIEPTYDKQTLLTTRFSVLVFNTNPNHALRLNALSLLSESAVVLMI